MPFEEICSKPRSTGRDKDCKEIVRTIDSGGQNAHEGPCRPGGVLLGILGGGGVPPGSPNPDPISDLRLERKQTNSSNPFRIRIFLFFSYSFGIETINTFIHSCSSPENYTLFQTKMDKVYTRFQSKTAQNPYPKGRHVPI